LKKLPQEKKSEFVKKVLVIAQSKEFTAKRDARSISYFKLLLIQELYKTKK
jgi:hypothetical protein